MEEKGITQWWRYCLAVAYIVRRIQISIDEFNNIISSFLQIIKTKVIFMSIYKSCSNNIFYNIFQNH